MGVVSHREALIVGLTRRPLGAVTMILFHAVARTTYLTPEVRAIVVVTIASENSSTLMMRLTSAEVI